MLTLFGLPSLLGENMPTAIYAVYQARPNPPPYEGQQLGPEYYDPTGVPFSIRKADGTLQSSHIQGHYYSGGDVDSDGTADTYWFAFFATTSLPTMTYFQAFYIGTDYGTDDDLGNRMPDLEGPGRSTWPPDDKKDKYPPDNHAPTGSVTISGEAAVGQTLTAHANLSDQDGLGSFIYRWQTSADGQTWDTVASGGDHYLVGADQAGKFIRVKVSYVDGLGKTETVNSGPTELHPALFDDTANTVDFNNLTSDQAAAWNASATYDALGGNDTVSLPSPGSAPPGYDFSRVFSGGEGNDTLAGGSGDDWIRGGPGDDWIYGSDGSDALFGDSGDDTFVYGASDVGAGKTVHIDGGTENTKDVLILDAAPGDYKVEVVLGSNWASTRTVLTTTDGTNVRFDTSEVERVRFLDPVANTVHLTNGSLYVEMLLLAREVYGHLPTLSHGPEDLGHGGDITRNAVAPSRNWHALSAMELGMRPLDTSSGALGYSMIDGHYQASDGSNEANALVLSGLVDGKHTIAIALRGTDEAGDFADYGTFKHHYDKYKPLVDALLRYLSEPDNHIDQVLVSGHSLGAGTMAYLLNALTSAASNGPLYDVKAFTDGSPGSEVSTSVTQVNFLDTDDLVTKVGSYSSALFAGLALVDPLAAALASLVGTSPKHRSGSDVLIDSDVSTGWGTTAHSSGLYLANVNKLVEFSRDGDSPFATTALATRLATNTMSGAFTSISIAVGGALNAVPADQLAAWDYTKFGSLVRGYAGNNFVLGNHAQDDSLYVTTADLLATQSTRWFDGATGADQLLLPFAKKDFDVKQHAGTSGQYSIRFLGNGEVTASGHVGNIARIEKIVYRDLVDRLIGTEKVQRLGGDSGVARARADGASSTAYTLKTGYDYAVAGDGKMSIAGTSSAEILYVGRGDKSIAVGDGNDIVIVKTAPGSKPLNEKIVIDGGKGADIMQGGRGAETFIVDDARDIVQDDGGKDTVKASIDYILPDGIETLILGGQAKVGLGNAAANTITGNGKANALGGLGGADTLSGGKGSDTLAGGAGKDHLTGGKGADTFVFDAKLGSKNVDTITDFKHGQDTIALDHAIFTGIGDKLEKAEFYARAGAVKAHDMSDRIVYDTKSGKLYYDDDGKGGRDAVHFATLSTKPGLDHGDFAIV